MTRKTSPRVAKSPGCLPLLRMYERAQAELPSRWAQVEALFRQAMWEFDEGFSAGKADQGDNQNGKGDFFNDLTALLLENCSQKALHGRGSVPGLIFRKHNLDTTYPLTGTVEVLIETKVAGAPKTSRNPLQKNALGRPGSADLDKRIKEAALKTIDLKAEWARTEGQGGGPTSDLLSWLKRSRPSSYLLLAVRVVDERDLVRTITFAEAANQMLDAVGLFAYQRTADEPGYKECTVPTHLELDRVLSRICTALRSLP